MKILAALAVPVVAYGLAIVVYTVLEFWLFFGPAVKAAVLKVLE